VLAAKLRVSHALCIPFKIICLGANLLHYFGGIGFDRAECTNQLFDFPPIQQALLVDLHPGFLFPFVIRVQLARDLPKMLAGYKVEALFAELKQQIKLRKARSRRLWNVAEQFYLAATAQNLKRLVGISRKSNHRTSAAFESSEKGWFCDPLSFEKALKTLKRIPTARLPLAVCMIFQQTQLFLHRDNPGSRSDTAPLHFQIWSRMDRTEVLKPPERQMSYTTRHALDRSDERRVT
jgi:hypothetical protein